MNRDIAKVRIHPHALERMQERGATKEEVIVAVRRGEKFRAKYGRTGFRHNYAYGRQWRGRRYSNKQVEVYTVKEAKNWLAISVMVKYF